MGPVPKDGPVCCKNKLHNWIVRLNLVSLFTQAGRPGPFDYQPFQGHAPTPSSSPIFSITTYLVMFHIIKARTAKDNDIFVINIPIFHGISAYRGCRQVAPYSAIL